MIEEQEQQRTSYTSLYFIGAIVVITVAFFVLQSTEEEIPLEITAQQNSGTPLAEKREAILTLVDKGSEGLTSEEKRGIRRALAGSAGRSFKFTREEVERILNVINN